MTPQTRHCFRLATFPFLLSLVAVLSACGGYGSGGSAGSSVPATDATVIDWFVGATNIQTTVKAGATLQWKSTDGMAHTVTSGSAPLLTGRR
jgi:plastocyanin